MLEYVSAAAQSIDLALTAAKLIRTSSTALDEATFKLQIAEVIEKLVDAKGHIQDIRQENLTLKQEIQGLKATLETKAQLEFDGVNYIQNLPDGKKDGPFCQKCWDDGKKLVRLQEKRYPSYSDWACRVCGCSFSGDSRDNSGFFGGSTRGLGNLM